MESDRASAAASASAAADSAARAEAAADLSDSIASGETVYADSEGHVSDELLRTTLREALDAGAAAAADPDASAAALQAAKDAIDSAAAAVAEAHIAAWDDINGTWCSDDQGCRTITNLKDSYDSNYVQNGGPDANGCLWGNTDSAAVTYCPKGSALSDPPCTMPEDVTRDRLYVRQDCAVPFYRR